MENDNPENLLLVTHETSSSNASQWWLNSGNRHLSGNNEVFSKWDESVRFSMKIECLL